jgi:hypothetical protein
MLSPSQKACVRAQQVGAVVGNLICNPLLGWLVNRGMAPVTLLGPNGIVVDTAITSVAASLLVGLFTAAGVRRERKAGRVAGLDAMSVPPLLRRLPHAPWKLGLVLGCGFALGLVLLVVATSCALAIGQVPAWSFLVFKAAYSAPLAYEVARLVGIQQLAVPSGRVEPERRRAIRP